MHKVAYVAKGEADLDAILTDLEDHGLEPILLDRPHGDIVSAASGIFRVRIAVPSEHLAAARTVIAENLRRGEPEARRHARAALRQMLALLLLAGALTGAALLLGASEVLAPIAGCVSALVVFATLGRRPRIAAFLAGERSAASPEAANGAVDGEAARSGEQEEER